MDLSKSMRHEYGRAVLRQAFRRLEHEVPGKVARVLRGLRHPDSRWVRISGGFPPHPWRDLLDPVVSGIVDAALGPSVDRR